MLPDTKAACSSRIGCPARRFESWGWVFWRAETSQKHQGVSQPAWAEQSLVLGVLRQIPAGGRARAGWKCLSAHPHPPLTTHGGAAALLTTPAGLELWVCSSLRAGRSRSPNGEGRQIPIWHLPSVGAGPNPVPALRDEPRASQLTPSWLCGQT